MFLCTLLRRLWKKNSAALQGKRKRRWTLERTERRVETAFGAVRVKGAAGFGVSREKAEFEDLARIAREKGCSLREAREALFQGVSEN